MHIYIYFFFIIAENVQESPEMAAGVWIYPIQKPGMIKADLLNASLIYFLKSDRSVIPRNEPFALYL